MTRAVVLLGSTGSIGRQALEVVAANPDRFRVVGLAADGADPSLLADQAARFGVAVVSVARPTAAAELRAALAGAPEVAPAAGWPPKLLSGPQAAAELAGWPCDTVLNALAGAAGLAASLAALDAGRMLALANKESLVAGGPLLADRTDRIVPVDSEHAAIAQCLRAGRREDVARLVITASGGPFRDRGPAELEEVTPEQALAHPTWVMGPLNTVNSATLVNKGLELIEAHLLFRIPLDRITVVVHPQSVVHSLVEFVDGAAVAQASPPDMRLPISAALAWPERVPAAAAPVDWRHAQRWEFSPLDDAQFPAVRLAREAAGLGGTAPAVFNAANERCVAEFLHRRLSFPGIVRTVTRVLAEHQPGRPGTLAEVLDADSWARIRAGELAAQGGG